MSITDNIRELRDLRETIREAINGKGVDLPEGSHMDTYASAINEISDVVEGPPGPPGPPGPQGEVGPPPAWVALTQAEYDALEPDPNTVYLVVEA